MVQYNQGGYPKEFYIMTVTYVFMVALICILFTMLLFYYFEASRKLSMLSAEVEALKSSSRTVNMSYSEALDALSEELKARRAAAITSDTSGE